MNARAPIATGVAFALAAAVAFGSTTPLVHRFGAGVGAFATACVLYAGAAAVALATIALRDRAASREARLRSVHVPRILRIALAGAVVAPAALAWGLQHADAARASLLLNLEAAFTVLLARAAFREPIGARVGVAVAVMLVGGSVAVASGVRAGEVLGSHATPLGLVAVAFASLAWAADNIWTRPLADVDPSSVVASKATAGAAMTCVVALVLREPWPGLREAGALLACGATGYGVSLRLYLLAQRRVGAARTGSVFAIAPFVGAAFAWLLGDGHPDGAALSAGALFAIAVYLHLTERHAHEHAHEPLVHEHAHRHDDGHHEHTHEGAEGAVGATHSHVHAHDATTHSHEHAPDVHHAHPH